LRKIRNAAKSVAMEEVTKKWLMRI
jgi:hypothetical protein